LKAWAIMLLVIGLAQMIGDVLGWRAVKGLAAATVFAPAPKVFSSVKGLETYSTRFFVEWTDRAGRRQSLELTPETCARIRGPYARRNVYGAALAYGPILASDEIGRELLRSVLDYGMTGEAPLLRELGIDPTEVRDLALRYEPRAGSSLAGLPTRIEVPLRP
jgi:hypothetical protein